MRFYAAFQNAIAFCLSLIPEAQFRVHIVYNCRPGLSYLFIAIGFLKVFREQIQRALNINTKNGDSGILNLLNKNMEILFVYLRN